MGNELFLWDVTFNWEDDFETRVIIAKDKKQAKEIAAHIKNKLGKKVWANMPIEESITKLGPCTERSWYLIDGTLL